MIHEWSEAVRAAMPVAGGLFGWLTGTLASAAFGLVAGGVAAIAVGLLKPLFGGGKAAH
jgi:predicted DNA repair protein MutK